MCNDEEEDIFQAIHDFSDVYTKVIRRMMMQDNKNEYTPIYGVLVHDYYNNKTVTVSFHGTTTSAQLFCEEYIDDRISLLQGSQKYEYVFDPPVKGTGFKEGCYCILYKDDFLKYTVYSRNRFIGWLYNSQEDVKLFDVSIIEILPSSIEEIEKFMGFALLVNAEKNPYTQMPLLPVDMLNEIKSLRKIEDS